MFESSLDQSKYLGNVIIQSMDLSMNFCQVEGVGVYPNY